MALKHVGRIKSNKRKVIVAYRVVPGEPDQCLVIQTENLSAEEHDSLIKAVESAAGQEAYEFGEAMARTVLPDGRNMLAGFHTTGKLRKVPSEAVEMTPTRNDIIDLNELNRIIAEQRGVTIADLALAGPDGKTVQVKEEKVNVADVYAVDSPEQKVENEVLSNDDLAKQLRSQADTMFKEAKALRDQAEELSPTKRKTATKNT